MTLVLALILVPFLVGGGLLAIRGDLLRRWVVSLAVIAAGVGSVALVMLPAPIQVDFPCSTSMGWVTRSCAWRSCWACILCTWGCGIADR